MLKSDGTVGCFGQCNGFIQTMPTNLTDAAAVSSGVHYMLALRSNGTVTAWAQLWGSGQGGDSVPAGLSGVVAIDASLDLSLAIRQDGTVVKWGDNSTPLPPGLSNIIAVSIGADPYPLPNPPPNQPNDYVHALALKSDGTVIAWGRGDFGETNIPAGLSNVIAISAGSYHNVALKGDGTVVVWGGRDTAVRTPPPGLSNVIAIAAGRGHTLALKSDGTVASWRSPSDDSQGAGLVPPGLNNVVAISATRFYSVALTMSAAPFITREPPAQIAVSQYNGFYLDVAAAGSVPLTYQWQKNGVALPGETNELLWFHSVEFEAAGNYTVVVSNALGSVTSQPCAVTIYPWLEFVTQPQSQTVNAGTNVTFSVVVNGSQPRTYQWMRNGLEISGATNSSLTLSNVQTEGGTYLVVVTSHGLVKESASAVLTVVGNVAPAITTPPRSETIWVGAQMRLQVTATGQAPLQYQWRRDGAILAGATNAVLNFASIQPSDAGDYTVSVSNSAGGTMSQPATLTIIPNPFIFGSTGAVVTIGGSPVPAGLDDLVSIAAGARHGVALRSDGTVVEWGTPGPLPGRTRVPAGLSNVVAIAAGGDQSAALRADGTVVSWGGSASPPGDLFGAIGIAIGVSHGLALKANGTVVQWGSSTVPPAVLNNVVGVDAGFLGSAAVKSDGSVVMWGNAFINNNLFAGRTDVVAVAFGLQHVAALRNNGTVLDYFGGSDPTNSAPAGLSNVVSIFCGATQSLALTANGSVIGWNNPILPVNPNHVLAVAAGDTFTLLLTRWPVITGHPQSLVINEGASASFSVTAAGTGPLAFQWQKNGADISGATNATFDIAMATVADVGNYAAIVSNGAGSVTSLVATLNVNTAPIIVSPPKSQTVFVGAKVAFAASVLGALPLTYQWRKDAVNLASETNATLGISSVQMSDAGPYTLVAANSYGSTTSAVATLAVTSHTFSWPTPGTVVGLDGPMVPPGLTNAVAIAAGSSSSLALRDNGTVAEWDALGPLGTARLPADLSNVVAISAHEFQVLALRSDGIVVAGIGTVPAPADLFGVVAIAAGLRNHLALKVDGTVATWGGPSTVPAGLSNVVAIAASDYGVALKSDGSAVMWGGNSINPNPNVLAGEDDLIAVAAGRFHVMALRSNGTALDYFGGSSPANTAPADLTDVIAIAAGERHSLALRSDGTVVRWNAAPTPAGIGSVSAIAAGRTHSLLITVDPPAPMLAAGRENGQFTIRTPISVSGYTLESATNLTQVLAPSGVTTNVLTFGEAGASGTPENAAMKFFRLRKIP